MHRCGGGGVEGAGLLLLTLQTVGLVKLHKIRSTFAESLHGAETAFYRIRTIHIVLAFTS